MKKSKQILKVISLIVILVIVLGSGFTLLFGEQIENVILKNINSKLKKEVSLSEINFSLFKNFPYASVTFTDLLINYYSLITNFLALFDGYLGPAKNNALVPKIKVTKFQKVNSIGPN